MHTRSQTARQLSSARSEPVDLDTLIRHAQRYYNLGTVFRIEPSGHMSKRISREQWATNQGVGLGVSDLPSVSAQTCEDCV